MEISKKDLFEYTDNIFCATKGKNYSISAWRHIMAWNSVDFTLAGDRWEVGGQCHGGRLVWDQRALMGAANLPLLYCSVRKK